MKAAATILFANLAACAFLQPAPAAESAKGAETVLHSFADGADGAQPWAGVIYDHCLLYGTTIYGGGTGCGSNLGCGTVFSVDPATGAEQIVYSFCSQQSCTTCADQNCPNGAAPKATLIDVKGTLYGTTIGGGTGTLSGGTVFALDPATGAEKVLYSFCSQQNCTDGGGPVAALIDAKGTLYGTTEGGGADWDGANGSGTVFALDPNTGTETVLHSFAGGAADGAEPTSVLLSAYGELYGTTTVGGTHNLGTIFKVNPKSGTERVLYSFGIADDGYQPEAGLINMGGILYGTTEYSTLKRGPGTVFSFDPKTGVETMLRHFDRYIGETSSAGVIDVDGMLYGTTGYGQFGFTGSVFSLDLATDEATTLYDFCSEQNCTDGSYPRAALIDVKGTLYGTTISGGANDWGTVFALKL